MSNENKAIVERWFEEIWNQGREDVIDELLAPDAVIHGLEHPDSIGKTGPEAFKPFFHAFRGAFPDIHITIETIVAEGDDVMTLFNVTASHKGDQLGLAATEKEINISGMTLARIQNGQLVEGRNNIDLLKLYQQINVLPVL